MFCTNCGSKLPDDALFCPDCGEKVQVDEIVEANNEPENGEPDLESENTDEDFEIPDIERTVVIKNENVSVPPTGETMVLGSDNSLPTDETVALGNNNAASVGETVVLGYGEAPVREDTQTVFNDIQESLAHPDIDFEHSQGYTEPNHANGGGNGIPPFGPGGMPGEMPPEGMPGGSFNMPGGPFNVPGDSFNTPGDENGQKPKQQKKIGLIVGIAACAVAAIVVIIVVVLMFSSMGKDKEAYDAQIKQGEEYMSDSAYDDAIKAFRDAIDIDDTSEDAYVGLAEAYIKNKDYRKAAEVLQQGSKATGGKKVIEDKKDELYEIAPELKEEFENNPQTDANNPSTPSQPSTPQTPETTAPKETEPSPVTPDTTAPDTTPTPPDTTPTQPDTTPTQPDTAPTQPDTTPTPPDTTPTQPDTTPDSQAPDETTESESGEVQPPESGSEGDEDSGDKVLGDIVTVGSIQYQMKEYYQEVKLPNDVVGAYSQVQYPYFIGDSQVVEEMNTYLESVVKSFNSSQELVKDYTGEEDVEFPLYDKAVFEVTYGDHGIISMNYVYETSHSAAKTIGLMFSGADGARLGWSDVLNGSIDDVMAQIQNYYKPEDNKDMPLDEFSKRLNGNPDNCYLNEDGIIIIAPGDESAQVLIPYTEQSCFKFLENEEPETAEEIESEAPEQSESVPETETTPETEAPEEAQIPEIQGASWVVAPSMDFEDVPVILDDILQYEAVVSNKFPLAVYKKDGNLGFVNYDGEILTEPIYNMVYGCFAGAGDYTLYASTVGNDIWSGEAVDLQTGMTQGGAHMGHGGKSYFVYSRSDGKLYGFEGENNYAETSNTTEAVMPVAVVDDIASLTYSQLQTGEGVTYGLYSVDGILDESHIYDHIYMPSDGRMVALSQGKYGVIDEAGNVVIPFEYEGASYIDFGTMSQSPTELAFLQSAPYPYCEGYIALKKDGMWGYYDTSGSCVTGMVFEEARTLSQGRAFVKMNGQWGIIQMD